MLKRSLTIISLMFFLQNCYKEAHEEIFLAIKNRNIEEIEKLLIQDPSLATFKDAQGATPIHKAIEIGSPEILAIFIKNKSNLNTQDEQGNTPLILATEYGYYPLVKQLIDAHVDLSIVNNHGQNAAKLAVENHKPEILSLFVQAGMTKEEYYPQLIATKLANKIQSIPFTNIEKNILLSIQNNDLGFFKSLIAEETDKRPKFTAQDTKTGRTLLHYVVAVPNVEFLKAYLLVDSSAIDVQDKEGVTPLLLAIARKQVDHIRTLILAGAGLRIFDNTLKNLLHYAVISRDLPTFNIVSNNYRSLNEQDIQGNTALHYAAQILDNTDILKSLLELRANPNTENKIHGDTPLHIAVKSENIEAIKILLKFNANPNIINYEQKTPKDIATTPEIQALF